MDHPKQNKPDPIQNKRTEIKVGPSSRLKTKTDLNSVKNNRDGRNKQKAN